ncbi:PadR family transcriptional regulator [Yinghuangia seranimata]|uniref:PadR family transcriptional regulator n=1 Tax=Yinghuangia seranimata TaxID=408067 RepID=UPI00248AD460|nr:helix-turn-helix transcriptional regulator [Yinghuangia seranimata]MDI2126531.1 helix-turn-helix transcriptional regulator [Yinghuangia seranimata]
MAARKPSTMLALAVLALVAERPMHPYEIARLLRERGKDLSIKINYGSLYTVVQVQEKNGFIEAVGTERDGRRPERTVYGLTEAGRAELVGGLSAIIAEPVNEFPRFGGALSIMGVLHPDEALRLLGLRLAALETAIETGRRELEDLRHVLPRVFVIEAEYALAMQQAEAAWVRGFAEQIADGTLDGVDAWRTFHETGSVPQDFVVDPSTVHAYLAQQAAKRAQEAAEQEQDAEEND